ncbi:CvpA family protein [Capnocytophaga catalasegens]|uniref:Colicin V production protein n=1 Tax=Capnocytophaga catalasegens TaxID=1004260 RepID=A0AAV5AT95_9FLAO|nr:CvpA family protein [Capnocytophaga catalasegens]GIZ14083.1 hypothetical protein RCZ03_00840 [Capnocytophaga catalasegens]GJM49081.1 hypothetical protein RCZ15_00570 [Capnocytophaga catalasegens]GJM52342.1 hypothetical protein RCZ16_06600 [Capnocytophaga catalasegens]
MNTIDVILAIILAIGFFRGLWKGLILEASALLAVVLGIYGAIYFSFYVSDYMTQNFDWDKQTIKITAFAFTLLTIMILVGILSKILTKIIEGASLGFVNRFFGGIFGLLKWTLIVGTSLQFLTRGYIPIIPEEYTQKSVLFMPVTKLSNLMYSQIFLLKENQEEKKENIEEIPFSEQNI